MNTPLQSLKKRKVNGHYRRKSVCDRPKALTNGLHDRNYLDILTTFIDFHSFANSAKTIKHCRNV